MERNNTSGSSGEPVFQGDAFIDGAFRGALSGRRFETTFPSTGARLADVADCGLEDIDLAVIAARRAFEQGRWTRLRPRDRRKIMLAWAELIERETDALARLESLDVGKPIAVSREFDIPSAVECLRFYAEAADKIFGEVAPLGPDILGTLTYEPKGVVGAIVPWNYPTLIAMWKIAPALVVGNSVVLKPSELAPLSMLRVAGLAREAGLPDGVLNVVPGQGPEAGSALARHMDVDAVSFTGSNEVGRKIMAYAAQSNLKSVSLELGGKSPNIIFSDCIDKADAAQSAVMGAFLNQGQTCNAGSRVLIEDGCYEEMLERIGEATRALVVGDPLDESVSMGPLISQAHADRVMGYVNRGLECGASLLYGGAEAQLGSGGRFVMPTVFENVDNRSELAQEEIFGPVMSIIRFSGDDEAIQIANDTKYGLAAGVWTGSVNRAHRVAAALRAGYVWVNAYHKSDICLPFGGYKQSGFGRDKSLHAIEKYTNLKSTLLHLS